MLTINNLDNCRNAEIRTLIVDPDSCVSRFCPSYAAYSVTVN